MKIKNVYIGILFLISSLSMYGMRLTFHGAAQAGNLEAVKHFINSGVDVNARTLWGNTALQYAVASHQLEIVKYLIDNGANINLKDRRGETALDVAHGTVMKLLLQLLKREGQEVTPTREQLRWAVEYGFCPIVEAMLESEKIGPTQEDIELAKSAWQRTKDLIYKKIGRTLVTYYGPWDSLLKQVGEKLTAAELPKEIVAIIGDFAGYDLFTGREK
jgi:Ankyrin repeats (3 copies)